MYHAALHGLLEFIAACQLECISSAARLVAMREEKVENMAQEVSPASAKRQRRASGAGSPSPYTTPPASVGPTMSDDMYMLMDEEEKTSVSMSGGRSGGRADREVLRVVTEGETYDDGYRWARRICCAVQGHTRSICSPISGMLHHVCHDALNTMLYLCSCLNVVLALADGLTCIQELGSAAQACAFS